MKIRERQLPQTPRAFSADLHPLLQKIYATRGVFSDQSLGRQLAELPTPQTLRGVEAALELLESAFVEQQKVLIVGDFDADGATSTALMILALRAMGLAQVDFLVPNRFEFGYGLTPEIVVLAQQNCPDLLITVDNGISSVEGVAAAKALGMRVLVTDHHLPGLTLPAADAIVNPNQPDCPFPGKNLAGVGVAFYLLSALRARLRQHGWFQNSGISEPNMASWLDLVALGTVADVVPLDQVNRVLVHQGLQRVRAGLCRPGIQALLELAGREQCRIVAADFGFAVGPRLNAAGRLDDMSLGIECLLSDDPVSARELAVQLDELNADRRLIETGMQQEALKAVEKLHLEDRDNLPWGLCLYDPDWHQGVVGLLASRIKERYHRPVIAFAEGDNGQLKGSARSIPGLHIRDALDGVAAANPGLLSKFGGHAMAAGLSLERDSLEHFREAFDREIRRQLRAEDLVEDVATDGTLAAAELNLGVAHLLRDAGPWGQHFPEPLFQGTFRVVQQRLLSGKHLKFTLCAEEDANLLVDAIAFNVPETLIKPSSDWVEILYRLDVNVWKGRESLQLLIERILTLQ
ncbi:MAG: single-stranded-DNA-specific exonuclease RecJ [Porticoccaceae bacterium]|nr:single-stranded-DNA-specific exonuclease RecJ [Porticoccaceae bacterium]